MPLTKDDIRSLAGKPTVIEVHVHSLNDTVFMRTPSIAEWRRITEAHTKHTAENGVPSMESMSEVVGACLSDSEGKRLFLRNEEDAIGDQFGYGVFMELYTACWEKVMQRDFGGEAKKD
jgi:hypothetical protein